MGRKVVGFLDGLINLCILVVMVALLALGVYSLWDNNTVYAQADASNYRMYKPEREPLVPSFEDLQALNPDVFAWLDLYGTHIDYPLVQGPDNGKYLNTSVVGKYSLSGALFLDYANARDLSDFNNVVYGHHMDKQAMFGEIGNFEEAEFFWQRAYGNLYMNGRDYGLAIFAVLHVDAYTTGLYEVPVTGQEAQAYLEEIYGGALHVRQEVPVSVDDRLLVMSTCSDSTTNGRTILVAKITDETYENTFVEEVNTGTGLGPSEWWHWLAGGLALLLVVLVLVFMLRRRKRKRSINDEELYKETQ